MHGIFTLAQVMSLRLMVTKGQENNNQHETTEKYLVNLINSVISKIDNQSKEHVVMGDIFWK